jgi:hypothetical protein
MSKPDMRIPVTVWLVQFFDSEKSIGSRVAPHRFPIPLRDRPDWMLAAEK